MKNVPVFNAYSRYYDLLYKDKDYKAEVQYIVSILKSNDITFSKILEFGSGTGKHGRLLAKEGYNITGIELSDNMVKQAYETDGFTCQQGDIRTVCIERSFDIVLALFHVMSYQVTNDDVSAVFQRAYDHLEVGGLFLFDVWYSPAVYNLKPENRVKRMMDDEVEVTRNAYPKIYPNENRVDVEYSVFVKEKINSQNHNFLETHSMRHFSIPEIEHFAEKNNFQVLKKEEFLTGNLPSENTWGVCFVLKKKA
jgi:SAM-dependent methyltransferase